MDIGGRIDVARGLVGALALAVLAGLATGVALGQEPEPPAGEWTAVHAPNREPLWAAGAPDLHAVHGVTLPDGRWVGWAVGDEGALLRYDDGWTVDPQLTSNPGALEYHFRDVFVRAPDDVWAVGHTEGDRTCEGCGFMAHYDGAEWRVLDKYEYGIIGRVAPLNALDMLQGPDGAWHGWAVGDDAEFDNIKAIILRYQDGGWDNWVGSNNNKNNLYDVKIIAPDEAWAVGQGGTEVWYKESDSGAGGWGSLGRSGVDTLYTVDLADPLCGWDAGIRGRMNHYKGACHTGDGQCWFDNAARPVLGAAGSPLNMDIHALDLLSREEGWLVGAAMSRKSIVAYLENPDGACTDPDDDRWHTVPVVSDPGRTLYDLHLVDSTRGYAVGADGVLLAYTAPDAPTATPPAATATVTATGTALPAVTPTAAMTITATATGTGTAVATVTATVTTTLTPAITSTPTAAATVTASPTPSDVPPATATSTTAPSATATDVPTAVATETAVVARGWVYLPFLWK